MIAALYDLLGIQASDLPYMGEQIILLVCLVLTFFGALAFFNAILNIIIGVLPGRE